MEAFTDFDLIMSLPWKLVLQCPNFTGDEGGEDWEDQRTNPRLDLDMNGDIHVAVQARALISQGESVSLYFFPLFLPFKRF